MVSNYNEGVRLARDCWEQEILSERYVKFYQRGALLDIRKEIFGDVCEFGRKIARVC